eukprot:sb/3478751/
MNELDESDPDLPGSSGEKALPDKSGCPVYRGSTGITSLQEVIESKVDNVTFNVLKTAENFADPDSLNLVIEKQSPRLKKNQGHQSDQRPHISGGRCWN